MDAFVFMVAMLSDIAYCVHNRYRLWTEFDSVSDIEYAFPHGETAAQREADSGAAAG